VRASRQDARSHPAAAQASPSGWYGPKDSGCDSDDDGDNGGDGNRGDAAASEYGLAFAGASSTVTHASEGSAVARVASTTAKVAATSVGCKSSVSHSNRTAAARADASACRLLALLLLLLLLLLERGDLLALALS